MTLLNEIRSILSRSDAIVLMYHRVATVQVDPWQLAVSEINFENQLQLLKKDFNVISLEELLDNLGSGRVKKNSVCITFDDGYRDNYFNAVAYLKKYNLPATFFIATGFVNSQKLFWWDALTQIFLETRQLPNYLRVDEMIFRLDNNGVMTEEEFISHKNWKWPASPPTQRARIYIELWEYIKPLNSEKILAITDNLVEWSGLNSKTDVMSLPMDAGQLSKISSDKLFSLGVHTVNHPALGFQPYSIQEMELTNSSKYLSRHFKTLNVVAYPYGNYNEETMKVMKEHFIAGFTTEEKTIKSRSDKYQLARFKVNDWSGARFKNQLKKWMTK